ncbi:MAG: hypothetical protein IJL38_08250 [Bacteroidales bacterium]|nr:hypothetical protein [Bacteroidales bacterium]
MAKKLLILLVAVVFSATLSLAQSDDFGLRIGAGPSRSGEIDFSWHKALSKYRLETNLGWATCDKWDYLNLSVAFHWYWNLKNGVAWYVGPGINMGWYFRDAQFGLGPGFQIGIEYNFKIPIQLSIDIFPRYNILGEDDARGLGGSGGLSIRYRF